MAFSKTPVNSTYQTKEIKLWSELNSRDYGISKDAFCLNVIPEVLKNKTTGENDFKLIKREGSLQFTSSVGSSVVRGAYLWKDMQRIYLAIGTDVYVYNSNTGVLITTLAGFFGTSTGEVGFAEFNYSTNIVKVVATDGTTMRTIDSSNVTVVCADPDLPTPHLPYPVVVDGYLFLVKAGTADIYNSDNDDPLAWTAGNFITAEMRPDTLVRISPLNNYIVAFGSKSIEYFYDAANTSGTPLARNDSPIKSVGYIGGFAQFGNKIYFVGETSESISEVFVLEDFKITPLASEAVRRHLEPVGSNPLIGTIISIKGHDFYSLYTGINTYVMELENNLWNLWSFQNLSNFPIIFSLQNISSLGYKNIFILNTSQAMYRFNPDNHQDNMQNFPCMMTTANEEFDSYNSKTANRLILWADKPTQSQPVTVQWTDDDYQTYNTGQVVELFQELPSIYRLGRFRRRAYRLTYTGPLPLRLFKMEIDLNLGNR